jgi:glyoxylase-like metal-dependent hydrolase (beta-lactamase superfamily II)
LLYGWPEPSTGKPIQDQEVIETEWFNFQVIYTPGHSPDHLCLYEPEQGWLFTGDLFVGGRDRALREDYNIWQIIASLKKIANLSITMLFPGSARVRENPQKEIITKINYLEDLGQRVLELHHKGWGAQKIARTLLGGLIWMEVFTLSNFSRRNLVNSYLRNTKRL